MWQHIVRRWIKNLKFSKLAACSATSYQILLVYDSSARQLASSLTRLLRPEKSNKPCHFHPQLTSGGTCRFLTHFYHKNLQIPGNWRHLHRQEVPIHRQRVYSRAYPDRCSAKDENATDHRDSPRLPTLFAQVQPIREEAQKHVCASVALLQVRYFF